VEFYGWVSVALGDKLENHYRHTLVGDLASLLRCRDITLKRYREAMADLARYRDNQRLFFLDSDNANIDLKDLSESVSALQKEAAALHVLAKTIKAAD